MMCIFITGATGFVGTHLRSYLLQATDWILVGTAFPRAPEDTHPSDREYLIYLDLRDRTSIEAALRDHQPDFIVHLAAQSHVPTAYHKPWETLENNILGQLNLLESCLALKIAPRILVIGSGEEYGRAEECDLPFRETHPLRPENPYSVSKVTQDVMGYQYYRSYDLPVLRVRPFNHVGPGQSDRFVLPAFASQIAEIEAGKRDPVMYVGNLAPKRDFTDVRDVVRAYHQILVSGTAGEVYNVASGQPRSIRQILDTLLHFSQRTIKVEVDPDRYRPADVPVIYGSAEKLTRDTGWSQRHSIDDTIHDVLTEWRERVS
jgi:GDP-4-dehydro-6-deoxy-D-mannose reductase